MRRCAAVTSVKDLLLEVDELFEYLKSHNGIVDQPINENNHIIEDALDMHMIGYANNAPAVRTAPDTRELRGCIPSANEIDTPTVVANPAMRSRMIQNILPNDSAPKRMHNTTVPPGHTVHPSKVQKPNPQITFNRMSAQGAQGYMANSYVTEPPMDTSHPFARRCGIQCHAR
jgi:hypothetical protein